MHEGQPHPLLAPLDFLIGTWRGVGVGGYPTIEGFQYGQEVSFAALPGKAVLAYTSRSWLLDDAGVPGRPLAAETGWWRPQEDGAVEVVLAHGSGVVEIYLGAVTGS